jgi:uncharacterized protein with HEPN domain
MQPDDRDAALLFDALTAARELTVIGEAISRLSEQFCEMHSEIEWQDPRPSNDYAKIDVDIIWSVVSAELPRLIAFIETTLPELPG